MTQTKKPSQEEIRRLLKKRMSSLMTEQYKEIDSSRIVYVFGSFPNGVSGPSSDLDVLVLAGRMSHWRHSGLDVVTVTPEKFESQAWRRSELATHIAKYGVRLKGSDCSLSETVPDSNAIKTKIKRIRAYVKALESKWTRFDALMKDKYAIKVKLDVLRLEIMRRGLAVPPTALLTDLAKTEGIDLQQAFDKAISSSEFSIAVKLRSKLLKLTQPVAHA